jgi:ribosomal protein S24E
MKVQIISEKENPIFKRKELVAAIDYEGKSTPSRAELIKLLAEQFKVGEEKIEINKVLSETGLSKGKAWIKIWQEKPPEKKKKVKKKGEKAAEEPKTEEKPAVKTEEKPKEETKVEEKK